MDVQVNPAPDLPSGVPPRDCSGSQIEAELVQGKDHRCQICNRTYERRDRKTACMMVEGVSTATFL